MRHDSRFPDGDASFQDVDIASRGEAGESFLIENICFLMYTLVYIR